MATWQHLRSSTANKRPTTSLADGRIAINTNTASPGLFFKDSAGTGIVKVGPVHVGTTAPNSVPAAGGSSGNYTGEQWLDTSVSPAQMKVWNGSTWVGIVADELPVSKLQDGAARQLIQTDAAGTGVEWTSDVDVPGTLDVTSTATFDSIAQHPLGTAGAPTITFTGDNNTGIYSPGADQVAISTNGSGRLFVDSSGRVGIGASPASKLLELIGFNDSNAEANTLRFTDIDGSASTDQQTGRIEFYTNDGTQSGVQSYILGAADNFAGAGSLRFGTGVAGSAVERLRITSTGALNFTGAGTAGVTQAVSFNGSAPVNSLVIDSSGRLLVGTSTSRVVEDLLGNGPQGLIQIEATNSDAIMSIISAGTADAGRAGTLSLGRHRNSTVGGTPTIVQNGDTLGAICFAGGDGTDMRTKGASIAAQVDGTPGVDDMPGRLVFSTCADGASSPTERMRIGANGFTKMIGDGSFVSASGNWHELVSNRSGDRVVDIRAQNASYTGQIAVIVGARTTTNSSYQLIYAANGNDTGIFRVFDSGNCQNTNNSYAGTSDLRLKQDITDASSQWSDIKNLQVRKYRFKDKPEEHLQIGLIAQEVETVSPGLVEENADYDQDGNQLETTTKSVKYSVLYMKAVKALQEAMERIETLEAKVAALESA